MRPCKRLQMSRDVLLSKGHFIAVLCEEEEFWLCQVREDIVSDLSDEDVIGITWLAESTPGLYKVEQQDLVRVCSFICHVELTFQNPGYLLAPTEREKIREFIAERAKDAVDAPILFDCNNAGEAPPLIGRPMKRLKSSHVADVAEVDIDDDNDDDDVDDDDDDDVDVNDIDDDDDIDDIDEVDDVKPKPKRKPTPKRRGRPPKGTKTRLTKQKRKVGRTKKPSLAKKRRKNTKDKILRVVMSNGKVSSKIRITCSGKTAKVNSGGLQVANESPMLDVPPSTPQFDEMPLPANHDQQDVMSMLQKNLPPRPEVVVKPDPFLAWTVTKPPTSDDRLLLAKDVIRAVLLNDYTLLKKLCFSTELAYSLFVERSADLPHTALYYAIAKSDSNALNLLFQAGKERDTTLMPPRCSTRLNDAVFEDDLVDGQYSRRVTYDIARDVMSALVNNSLVTESALDLIVAHVDEFIEFASRRVHLLLREGRHSTAAYILRRARLRPDYAFSALHLEALTLKCGESFTSLEQSMRRSTDNWRVTPLQCAAINPNPAALEGLLTSVDAIDTVLDVKGNSLFHYAAVCSGSGPLQLLLARTGHDGLMLCNNDAETCLTWAARSGRTENVKCILKHLQDNIEVTVALVLNADKNKYTALHFASQRGHTDIVELMLLAGADPRSLTNAAETALILAAAAGHLRVVRLLCDIGGADMNQRGKDGHTALMVAAKNGHVHVVTFLMRQGAEIELVDDFLNNSMHYAAGYGWDSCVEALLDAAPYLADKPNASARTPLTVAAMKCNAQCAELLVRRSDTNINLPDVGSRTLITHLCELVCVKTAVDNGNDVAASVIRHLLTRKDLMLHAYNANGHALIHILAGFKNGDDLRTSTLLRDLLAYKGMDVNAPIHAPAIDAGVCALHIALSERKLMTANVLLSHGAAIDGHNAAHRNILHMLTLASATDPTTAQKLLSHLMNAPVRTIKLLCLEQDDEGFTPPLLALHQLALEATARFTAGDAVQLAGADGVVLSVEGSFARTQAAIFYTVRLSGGDVKNAVPEAELVQATNNNGAVAKSKMKSLEFLCSFVKWSVSLLAGERALDAASRAGKLRRFRDVHPGSPMTDDGLDDVDEDDEFGRACGRSLVHMAALCSDPTLSLKIFSLLLPLCASLADSLDSLGLTPLALLCTQPHRSLGAVRQLVRVDAARVTLNRFSAAGDTPLSLELSRHVEPSLPIIEMLLDAGADVTLPNKSLLAPTPLHLAVQLRDANRWVEMLLKRGAPVNARDGLGRTPLHLAVLDGVESLVRTLLAHGADVNAQDDSGSTALHLAVARSAKVGINAACNIESLLLRAGANPNALDRLSSLPLHYAFLAHEITFDASVPIVPFDPIMLVSLLCLSESSIDVADVNGRRPLHFAARCGATTCVQHLLDRGADMDARDCDGNSALGVAVLCRHEAVALTLLQSGANVIAAVHTVVRDAQSKLVVERHESSLFQAAVEANWQGVAFKLLERGFDLVDALHDALRSSKFGLVQVLLSRAAPPSFAASPNAQTLLHTLASCPRSVAFLERWFAPLLVELMSRGVSLDATCAAGRTALHVAAMGGQLPLVQELVRLGAQPMCRDLASATPAGLAMLAWTRGRLSSMTLLHVLRALATMYDGAEPVTRLDADELLVPAVQRGEFAVVACCLRFCGCITGKTLSHALRLGIERNYTSIVLALLSAASPSSSGSSSVASEVSDAFVEEAVVAYTELAGASLSERELRRQVRDSVEFHLTERDAVEIPLQFENDGQMSTLLHLCVASHELGSYENTVILRALVEHGADLGVCDSRGRTPLDLARHQLSGVMTNVLLELGGSGEVVPSFVTDQSSLRNDVAVEPVDLDGDLADALRALDSAGVNELVERVPRPRGFIVVTVDVVRFPDTNRFADVLLSRVELPDVLCYCHLQVVQLRSEFVLTSSCGKSDDINVDDFEMSTSRTSFVTAADALAEFERVFLEMTGNNWRDESFTRQPGMFVKVPQVQQQRVDTHMLFDRLTSAASSTLPTSLAETLTTLSDVTMLRQAMTSFELPLCALSQKRIQDGMELLLDARALLLEATALNGVARLEPLETLAQACRKFTTLFPSNRRRRLFKSISDLENEMLLLSRLSELLAAVELLMGASIRAASLHPLDYCYRALRCELREVPEEQLVRRLLQRVSTDVAVVRVYEVQRTGEAQRYARWNGVANRRLLFHGARNESVLGLLHNGLRIPPAGVPNADQSLGKGLYFSDAVEQVLPFCSSVTSGSRSFLLLTEVALGTMTRVRSCPYTEAPFAGSDSTVGVGKLAPRTSVVLPSGARCAVGELGENNIVPADCQHWTRNGTFVPDHENEALERAFKDAVSFPVEVKMNEQWSATLNKDGFASVKSTGANATNGESMRRQTLPRKSFLADTERRFNQFVVYDESRVRLRYLVELSATAPNTVKGSFS